MVYNRWGYTHTRLQSPAGTSQGESVQKGAVRSGPRVQPFLIPQINYLRETGGQKPLFSKTQALQRAEQLQEVAALIRDFRSLVEEQRHVPQLLLCFSCAR